MKRLHEPVQASGLTTVHRSSFRPRAIAFVLGAIVFGGASVAWSDGEPPQSVVAYAVAVAALMGVVALAAAIRRVRFDGAFPLVTLLAGTWAVLASLVSAWTSDQDVAAGLLPMAVGLAVLTLVRGGLELLGDGGAQSKKENG